jgi:flagella basal body P-ring formation protein FlgA
MDTRLLLRFAAAALALALLHPVHAASEGYTDPQAIRAAAIAAVRAAAPAGNTGLLIEADAPDSRLRLPLCPEALHAFIAGDGQARDHTTVAVRCEAGNRWALYLGVTVATEFPVLVALHALPAGSTPAAVDFTTVMRRMPGLASNYVSDATQLAGRRLRRPVAMNEALDAAALAIAPIVHRGQQLTLLAHASGMDIRVTVVALADGRPDERIHVQNVGSQRIVEATVRGAGLVEIPL